MKITDREIIEALQEGKYIMRKSCKNDYSLNKAFLRGGTCLIWKGEYTDFIVPFDDIISDDWVIE